MEQVPKSQSYKKQMRNWEYDSNKNVQNVCWDKIRRIDKMFRQSETEN